jgi:hypothetical protein
MVYVKKFVRSINQSLSHCNHAIEALPESDVSE